jgi:cytochrome c553
MRRQRPSYYMSAVTNGVSGTAMERWDHVLPEVDRWDAAMFAWTLSLDPVALSRGHAVYAARCSRCHGSDGSRIEAGPLATVRRAALTRAQASEQIRRAHPAAGVTLGDSAVEGLADYVSTFLVQQPSVRASPWPDTR